MSAVLLKYIPEESLPLVAQWLKTYKLHLRITKPRKTKLGDFRPAHAGKAAKISVNGDLNPYQFVVTLTHEVAHAVVWEKHQRKVLPHGVEWQQTYSRMLEDLLQKVNFPEEIKQAIQKHIHRPKASSASDPNLYRTLKKYDEGTKILHLEDIEEDSLFVFRGNRLFRKGKKRRSRFECQDQKNKKIYLISGIAEVELFQEQANA